MNAYGGYDMKTIIKNGYEKVFCCRCSNCATDFTYTIEDISTGYPDKALLEDIEQPIVECPVCKANISASMISKEDEEKYNKSCPISYGLL